MLREARACDSHLSTHSISIHASVAMSGTVCTVLDSTACRERQHSAVKYHDNSMSLAAHVAAEHSLCCAHRELPHIPAAAELSAADVIAIADRLFAAEVTWFRGSPLAQTLFTCLYLLEPHRHAILLLSYVHKDAEHISSPMHNETLSLSASQRLHFDDCAMYYCHVHLGWVISRRESLVLFCRVAVSESNPALRALCCAAHAACVLIRDLVLSGNVCEVWSSSPGSIQLCALCSNALPMIVITTVRSHKHSVLCRARASHLPSLCRRKTLSSTPLASRQCSTSGGPMSAPPWRTLLSP